PANRSYDRIALPEFFFYDPVTIGYGLAWGRVPKDAGMAAGGPPGQKGTGMTMQRTAGEATTSRFAHPGWFWAGVAAVSTGVLFHVPMFFGARSDHYQLTGMGMSGLMLLGMALILGGFGAVYYGLSPKFMHRASESRLGVQAMDESRLKPGPDGLLR